MWRSALAGIGIGTGLALALAVPSMVLRHLSSTADAGFRVLLMSLALTLLFLGIVLGILSAVREDDP